MLSCVGSPNSYSQRAAAPTASWECHLEGVLKDCSIKGSAYHKILVVDTAAQKLPLNELAALE